MAFLSGKFGFCGNLVLSVYSKSLHLCNLLGDKRSFG